MGDEKMFGIEFDRFILANLPHFIAINYQRLLEAQMSRKQVKYALRVYDLVLRLLTICMVSQYLIRDRERVSDSYLNELLVQKFPCLTLDSWQQLLFISLKVYEGQEELFFINELYKFYWDTSIVPHERFFEIEEAFNRLTQISMEMKTERLRPQSEAHWEELARETMGLLQQILPNLSFMERYELVRVLDYNELYCDLELHKGLNVAVKRQPLPKHAQFSRGWFYLRKGMEDFLLLHPLLVFWERESSESDLVPTDTGVYERFVYDKLQYFLTTLDRIVLDCDSVKTFMILLYDTIEEAKRRRQEVEKLTWWQLRDICNDITKRRMATVRHKYRKELYLPRCKTRQEVIKFLESEKRCFVLIGKSGVGKSNFLLALRDELHKSRSDVCLLMYDGAHLTVEPTVSEFISQDFDDRLVLADQQVQKVWHEMAKVEGIENRLVILCVDAINENPHAKEILKQLNELVQSPWRWLKIIFSSRPETWQTIKRGVKLAEVYYYSAEETASISKDLEPFSYSERMEPFSRQELPKVYSKHQKVFDLQTRYSELPMELRETLQEPLNLWLVANIYEGKGIPYTLKITAIVKQYMNALVRSERLREEDLRFLEKKLVPLLIIEGRYANAITIADIDAAGGELYEAVYSEQVLSDGQKMNQSLTNLLDAEIMMRQRESREQRIVFKYERFYEYFAGRAMLEEMESQDSWKEQYRDWTVQLPKSPYLWGAIKSCLEQQMHKLQVSECTMLCIELTQINDRRMDEILIAALTEYGKDDTQKVQEVIQHMLGQKKSWLQSILNREELSTQCPTWKRIAINVASNLKLGTILEFALSDSSSAVRAVAVRHAFIYWRQEREAGFLLLENLTNKAKGFFGLPILSMIESSAVLSLLILFHDFQNVETTGRLRRIWHRTISWLLRVNSKKLEGKRERIKGWFRTALLQAVVRIAVGRAKEIPTHNALTIPEMKLFFKHDKEMQRRRARAAKIVRYMDVENTRVQEIRDDLLDLVDERDMLITMLAIIMLRRQAVAYPEDTLPLLKELFDRAIKVNPPGPFGILVPSRVVFAQPNFLSKKLYLDIVTTYLDRFQGKWWSHLQVRRYSYLDAVCLAERDSVNDTTLTPTSKRYVEEMISDKNYAWMKDFIQLEVTTQAVEVGNLNFAFNVLEMLLNVQEAAVRDTIIESLARIRVYYPDQVEDFMETNALARKEVMAVRRRMPSETIGDLLDYNAMVFWEDIQNSGTPELWKRLINLFSQLPECSSLGQWFTDILKFMVNEIYGGPVFRG